MVTFQRYPLSSFLASKLVLCGCLALFSVGAGAIPSVIVVSPKSGVSTGSPIFYEAYATSPQCGSGISAMRIYSADYVNAYTIDGAHLETFIQLSPGTYKTTVQAWDNCGGVAKVTVNLTVSATGGVSVFLPSSGGGPASWPVHVAASAQNSACAGGINAIRIYTGDQVSPYTVNSNQLDAYVNLLPGTYKLTVQAWDNCGNVFKAPFSQTVISTPDAYLYAVNLNPTAADIYQFQVASDGTLKNPNGSGPLPEFGAGTGAGILAVDPGGWFLYASTRDNIYGYQIDQSSGNLVSMPGSPFPLNDSNHDIPPSISLDPSGNFLLARYGRGIATGSLTTYRVNRSSGALASTGYLVTTMVDSRTFDFSGQYIYAVNAGALDGWRLDPNTGNLTPLAGSPFAFRSIAQLYSITLGAAGSYLYAGGADISGNGNEGAVVGLKVDYSTGMPSEIGGSPFVIHDYQPWGTLADWRARFIWTYQIGQLRGVVAFDIQRGTGRLSPSTLFTVLDMGLDPTNGGTWIEDHSGSYLFTSYDVGDPTNGQAPGIASWTISANGDLQAPTSYLTANPIGAIAVARKDPK